MAARLKNNAVGRAKRKEMEQNRTIVDPLVEYRNGVPVCKVCNDVVKPDLWKAHQVSRKHHEAISNLKARLVKNANAGPAEESHKSKPEFSSDVHAAKMQQSSQKSQPSSVLPAGFFDHHEPKRQSTGTNAAKAFDSGLSGKPISSSPTIAPDQVGTGKTADEAIRPVASAMMEVDQEPDKNQRHVEFAKQEAAPMKGALPQGFFDNKDADLRARGIEPVKPDIKDEYKEFEKSIQEDLKEVDNRMEEEEVDAAEMIEEEETVEQKTYRERVEFLKKKRMELIAAKPSKPNGNSKAEDKKPDQDGSSSDDGDSDESFTVDWRAQHL
ncbi:ABA AND ROS SENSITIVE 1-like protein [Drosera capensis]